MAAVNLSFLNTTRYTPLRNEYESTNVADFTRTISLVIDCFCIFTVRLPAFVILGMHGIQPIFLRTGVVAAVVFWSMSISMFFREAKWFSRPIRLAEYRTYRELNRLQFCDVRTMRGKVSAHKVRGRGSERSERGEAHARLKRKRAASLGSRPPEPPPAAGEVSSLNPNPPPLPSKFVSELADMADDSELRSLIDMPYLFEIT
jgi:hypothetical protein